MHNPIQFLHRSSLSDVGSFNIVEAFRVGVFAIVYLLEKDKNYRLSID